jgi:hypothetical protein
MSRRARARQCTRKVLVIAAPFAEICSQLSGGLRYGAPEASFEAKGAKDNLAGIRGGRSVSGDGGQRIGGNRADSKRTVAGHRAASRHLSRRRGNLRRQPGDVLRLRQGKRPARRRRETCSTRRLRRLRLQRLRGTRLQRLRRLRRLRSTSLPRLRRLWLQGLRSTSLERVRRVWRLRLRLRTVLDMVRLGPDLGLLERA